MATTQDQTRRLLAHVATRLGGVGRLASKLDVNPDLLGRYISGGEKIPEDLVLRVVDVLLDDADSTNPKAALAYLKQQEQHLLKKK